MGGVYTGDKLTTITTERNALVALYFLLFVLVSANLIVFYRSRRAM